MGTRARGCGLKPGLGLKTHRILLCVEEVRGLGPGWAFEKPGGWVGGQHLPGTQWGGDEAAHPRTGAHASDCLPVVRMPCMHS